MAPSEALAYQDRTRTIDFSQAAARQERSHAHKIPDIAGGLVPGIRVTGILVEDGKILLVKQELAGGARTHWSLPGGMLELGESLQQGLQREMMEETGLQVSVGDLLYVSDRFRSLGHHLVDMSFRISRTGGTLLSRSESDGGREVLSRIEMVPIDCLTDYGFSQRFADVVVQDFPDSGAYVGNFHDFY